MAWRGKAFIAEENWDKARVEIKNVLQIDPKSAEAYYLLARVYSEGLRDDDKALMVLDYVLAHFPNHALNGQIGNYRSVLQAMKENAPAKMPQT